MSVVTPIVSHASDDVRRGLERAGRHAARAKAARDAAFEELAAKVREAIAAGLTEVDAARLAGVDRMTVRRWVGKL